MRGRAHRLSGATNSTGAGAGNEIVTALWNPHSTKRIRLVELTLQARASQVAPGGQGHLYRTTTQGTTSSSVTTAIQNASNRDGAGASGAILGLTYTASPTFDGGPLMTWHAMGLGSSAMISSLIWPLDIEIPPGSGIGWAKEAAAVAWSLGRVNVVWEE